MTDANNNSGNNGFNITIGGGGGGAAANGTIYTYTPSGQWITVPFPVQQISLPFEEPVEEKKCNSDGCVCKKCKELFPYAEPNQEDGTLICYSCRMRW